MKILTTIMKALNLKKEKREPIEYVLKVEDYVIINK